jgi:hypothetical protein
MSYVNRAAALLPTGTRMNPSKPDDAEYFDPGQTAYVVRPAHQSATGGEKVFTSFGNCGESWKIGTIHEVEHDQTGRFQGAFQVIGIASFDGIRVTQGEVPDRKLPHWVFK